MSGLYAKALRQVFEKYGMLEAGQTAYPDQRVTFKTEWDAGLGYDLEEQCSVSAILSANYSLWHPYSIELLARMIALGQKTLYVGAGSGRFGLALQARGVECHSVDISQDAVDLMAMLNVPNVT